MPDHAGSPAIAIGCMRLSTAPDRDDERSIGVLHAALAAGVTLLDTADVYCHGESDVGHNERLIARALASYGGPPGTVRVATKGGLTRPHGQWIPDGRARTLTLACEASLRALSLDRIPLYQLHAPDPRVALATSVRALHSLQRGGLIGAIGLCNVTVGQIEEARAIAEIASVQVEVHLWNDSAILGGVLDYCSRHGIQLLAHRPLGGPERRRRIQTDTVLADLANSRGATPFEIALASVAHLSPLVVPLPGPTRPETAASSARLRAIALTDDDRSRLAAVFPLYRAMSLPSHATVSVPAAGAAGEAVIVMGLPAAGKSTVSESLAADGYTRLNRDETGGSLRALLDVFDRVVASGQRRVVLDNTYVSRKSRGAVLQAAARHGLPVRCVWLTTGIDDAQVNAASRLVSRYGRLLDPADLREAGRDDPAAFGPAVQFRYQRELEPPDLSEGFSRVDVVAFERRAEASSLNRAVIVWCDGILVHSRSGVRMPLSAADAVVDAGRGAILRRYYESGWKILGLSWLPEIAAQSMSAADAAALFDALREQLGVPIEVEYCPHAAGPPACWCRKPLPGLGVVFIRRHGLDPAHSIYVGSGSQDPGFARKLGLRYRDAEEFFGAPESGSTG